MKFWYVVGPRNELSTSLVSQGFLYVCVDCIEHVVVAGTCIEATCGGQDDTCVDCMDCVVACIGGTCINGDVRALLQ